MSGLTLNAMVFKHSQYPNAAKAFLQFMMEKEQYEPWLNANSGYWAQPLAAYADAAVWSGDPKVKIFKDTMKSTYYDRLQGPDLDRHRRRQRRLRAGADVRLRRHRRRDAGSGGRGSRAAREAVFPSFVEKHHCRLPHTSSFRECVARRNAQLRIGESRIPGSMLRIAPE